MRGGIREKEETSIIVNNQIIEPADDKDTGPLFRIRFLEGFGRGICVGSVYGGEIFCMSLVD